MPSPFSVAQGYWLHCYYARVGTGTKAKQQQIEEAVEVFVRGFSLTKSRTHPYECARVDGVWVMRDTERRRAAHYRKEEWITYGGTPSIVDSIARKGTRGRFFVGAVCEWGQSMEELRDAYKALGYRLIATEPFFVQPLQRIPKAPAPVRLEQIKTIDLAVRFGKATRTRPIAAEDLGVQAPFRQYVALDGDEIVGWVRSVVVGASTWCSNMYARPSHRRQGIGKALLVRMLRDDRAHGAKWSVLLSSHAGALLYPKVGYEQIGTLLMLAPRKAR